MSGKGRFAKTAVTYAVKYGPLVYEAVKHGREPAQRAIQKAFARQADRRRALTHAATVVDGSILRVFHQGEPAWVVFSGDTAVASYPAVATPLPSLLQHADLNLRVRPPQPGSRHRPSVPALPKLPNLPNPANLPGLRDLPKLPDKLPDIPGLVRRTARRPGNGNPSSSDPSSSDPSSSDPSSSEPKGSEPKGSGDTP